MARRPRTARDCPELPFLAFAWQDVLAREQARLPGANEWRVQLWFQRQPTLACIARTGKRCAEIRMHTLLNHPQTPRPVLDVVIGHELLHLLHPPREIDDRWITHTTEFRAAEKAQYPEAETAHVWIHLALGLHLRRDVKHECIRVNGDWQVCGLGHSRPEWSEAQQWVAEYGTGRKGAGGREALAC